MKRANNKKKPPTKKKPRQSKDPESFMSCHPAWQFRSLDINCSEIDSNTIFDEILPKIQNYESMFWKEILDSSRDHFIKVERIIQRAKDRLVELQQEDIDSLVSLHIDGTKRIWGIIDGNIMKILWWDPNHEICPSNKKHT